MTSPIDDPRERDQVEGMNPDQALALLRALMNDQVSTFAWPEPQPPQLLDVPSEVRGFRVRLDLHGARPPIWRRLELPGDLTLPLLHEVIQTGMGWFDAHLHRFRTGRDPRSPYFITAIDIAQGDDGTPEQGVRLDQLVAEPGDELWYDYDFGDGWEHRLVVEDVLDSPPATPRCIAGRNACPPEDCGGLGGYEELAAWVRSGYDERMLPTSFEDAAHGRRWLPIEWHPDTFSVEETDALLVAVGQEPVSVTGELAVIASRLEQRASHKLRNVLGRPQSHEPAEISDDDATRLTESYRILLEVVGDGVDLTAAGYLRPALVEELARRTGVTEWWLGKVGREDSVFPVAVLHETARDLGLVRVRKGRLSPTAAAKRCAGDPQAVLRHIVGRLPLGTKDAQRESGWLALAVAGSGLPVEQWAEEIAELLFDLGWRTRSGDVMLPPTADSPTLDVLEILAGACRVGWGDVEGVDPAVAATARTVIRRG